MLMLSEQLTLISGYTISYEVTPSEARRQGLVQEDPCPSDMIVFTCTRSISSTVTYTLLWAITSSPIDLYSFNIPDDIGTPNANKSSVPGFIGVLVNDRTFLLVVNLRITSTHVLNTREMFCGQIGGPISDPSKTVMIVGGK